MANETIQKLILTEKTNKLLEVGKYVFWIDPSVNKIQLKQFVESEFNVTVTSVNIMNVIGKTKRRGRFLGKNPDRKKAIVTLATGEEIKEIKKQF